MRLGCPSCIVRIQMIIFIASKDFSKNRFLKISGLLAKTFLDSNYLFPLGAQKCVLRLRTTIVKKSDIFAKRDFVRFFRTRARMFGIFGQNVPKGVEKLHPTCPEDHFAGKLLIKILSF